VETNVINRSESWYNDLREAVSSRRQDYIDFQNQEKLPLFPQFITFNMQAEYFHALYEYELSCLIEKQINPEFEAEDFPNYENFQTWQKENLTITDVLSVSGKVERIEKLKADYVREEVKRLVEKLVTDEKERDTVYRQLQDFSPEIVSAILSADAVKIKKTETKFGDKIKDALTPYHIEPSLEVGASIGVLFAKVKLVLKKGR